MSPGTVVMRWEKVTATAVGHAVEVEVVRSVVEGEGVVDEEEARRTTGSPFVRVTQISPAPLEVTTALEVP